MAIENVDVTMSIKAQESNPEEADAPMMEVDVKYRRLPQDAAQGLEFGGAEGIIAAIKKVAGFSG